MHRRRIGLDVPAEHHEPHRLLAGVHGSEPGVRVGVGDGLRQGDRHRAHELLLLGRRPQGHHGVAVAVVDLSQGDRDHPATLATPGHGGQVMGRGVVTRVQGCVERASPGEAADPANVRKLQAAVGFC